MLIGQYHERNVRLEALEQEVKKLRHKIHKIHEDNEDIEELLKKTYRLMKEISGKDKDEYHEDED